ncbi:zinc finger SWIM domain-containing protein 1 [Hyla sarda]|uniref:zinc finger SWIM domain-containing protein 1 n=1 Tax=Hyla sarda TaxID=327740 RepID=UPI0024C32277|nr:zinc finger SWIM domain-containing protein 1 [Hyla sarda]XP_056405980.1 zinc finger SWIM domain-containing protein 1 [Hyla sarda]XP_056405981.1 zinc finger SWIM domain-containing protein 1 [Hyla sarda]XP_056405982.1 zinc finger SWIM domain-containing protein 1 [Hyla sarda]XP_056405984.1 zinc finger SWIM domain-containing protein 1 [Hyla sarda]
MNPEFLEKLFAADANSNVVCQVTKSLSISFVNFQTSTMGEIFSKFPEVLQILHFQASDQRTLYTFLVDGPRIGSEYDATRMVHIAVPSNDTPKGLARMLRSMKDMNPCWRSIRVILVEPYFTELGIIHEAFPSAEVVLSAYHVYALMQRHIQVFQLEYKVEINLLDALNNTMCSVTEQNLKNLHSILQRVVDPGALSEMNPDWLLTDKIWALHRWRTGGDCSWYFKMVESLSSELNAVLKISPFLTETMNTLVSFILDHIVGKSQPEPRSCSPEELALIECKGGASKRAATEAQMEPEAAALMCESLHNICNAAAFGLCQNELEVTQKSVDLVGAKGDNMCVQILENPNKVSSGIRKTCTCSFYRSTELPCRHIMSILNAREETLQPDMLHPLWQKQNDVDESALPVTPDTLEILKGEGSGVSEKHLLVNSLTGQMSALLAECSDEVFERRYSTLRGLADSWIGPYDQVKL